MLEYYFITGLLFIITSVIIFEKKTTLSIVLLLVGAFLLRVWAIQLDPFLNMWDEQFHALVAKTLSNNLLSPQLLPDIPLANKVNDWSYDHIWLHKQPFFMWLMALSIKIFGVSEWAIRIPSVLLGTMAVFGSYKLGKNLIRHKVGFIAALLIATSYISLSLTSGYQGTDHNDLVFSSLIIISFWFYSEYYVTKKLKWAIFTGFVVGLAVLTKWLTGLIIFIPWAVIVLKNYRNVKEWKGIVIAFLTSLITFIPWQIYCYINYYKSYKYELEYNTRHLSEAIEGHGGGYSYHFDQLNLIYFNVEYWTMLTIFISAILIVLVKIKSTEKRILILLPITVVYLFFTFVATKMPLFTYAISGLVYLTFAFLIVYLLDLLTKYLRLNTKTSTIFNVIILLIVIFFNLNFLELKKVHGFGGEKGSYYWQLKEKEKKDIIDFKHNLSNKEKYIIFNTRERSYPSFTFYTGYPAYDFLPTKKDIHLLREKGYEIIILDTGNLPKELIENKGVHLYQFPK